MIQRVFSILLFFGIVTDSHSAHILPDFSVLAAENSAAVVNISTRQKKASKLSQKLPDVPKDSPFYEFFQRFLGENMAPFKERESSSLGSGFILSKEGYILTNHHVVSGADEIIVRLSDRRQLDAVIVGVDQRSDIALLKIEADHLQAVKLGNSDDLKVGEWVLAIGSPFGFDHSVTAGIVSAKGRSLPDENYIPFIQTDVAINPGNSGGPLINLDGEVIGVNAQIYSKTGGFMGLSFTIPINVAMDVVKQLRDHGRVARGWLGVLIQQVTRELAESFSMNMPQGALVAQVLPDSPASKAGLEVGDIILTFDGKEVANSASLPPMVGGTPIDQRVALEVLRKGKRLSLFLWIEELPSDENIKQSRQSIGDEPALKNVLGVQLQKLTNLQRQALSIPQGGVLVEGVSEGVASRGGIHPGDVLLRLNNVKIRDMAHVYQLLPKLPRNKLLPILIQRDKRHVFLALEIPG